MTCCDGPTVQELSGHFGHQALSARIEEMTRNLKPMADGRHMLVLDVPGVHCGACITSIERGLTGIAGVISARVNLTLHRVTIVADKADVAAQVARALDGLGYAAAPAPADGTRANSPEIRQLIKAMAVAGFAAANIMLLSVSVWTGADGATRDLFHFVSALIAIPAVTYAGQPFFRSAWQALRHRRMNMDVPISLGVILATAMSLYESLAGGGHAYFDAAVSLLFFLLIGRTLDAMLRGKARQLVGQMALLSAKGGFVIGADGSLTYAALDALVPGQRLRVAAGERLPVDARVLSGRSDVDRSLVTGESRPVAAAAGSDLEAGTLNLTGSLDVEVLRPAGQSFLGEVMQMLSAAEEGRGHYTRLADRMARIYSPAVHIAALLTFLGWMLVTGGDWHQSVTIAVAVLIITCPCALGLAVPVAHVVAASRLFRAGVLVKDGSAMERLAEIDQACFDKTGTLTDGALRVTASTLAPGEEESLARSLALHSRHPASQALARDLPHAPVVALTDVSERPGFGCEAVYRGRRVRLGRMAWVAEIASVPVDGSFGFAIEGEPCRTARFAERLRPGAAGAAQSLTERAIPCRILSGDGPDAVATVADAVGIAQFAAGLTPGGKIAELEALRATGRKVLMVGDGLNDAPALAAAHVSMAPATASDIGRNAADFVFIRGDLSAIAMAHQVALKASAIVRQNFALAILYNVIAVPLAVMGHLSPLIAAVAMSTSSIIVVGNSLRLYGRRGAAPALRSGRSAASTRLEPVT